MLKKRFLRALLISSVMVLFLFVFSGATSADCCVFSPEEGGGCYIPPSGLCDIQFAQYGGLGGQYQSADCSAISDCDIGCCCAPGGNSYIYRNFCSLVTGSEFNPFSPYDETKSPDISDFECTLYCTGGVCQQNQTFTCPDGATITTAACVEGALIPTTEACSGVSIPPEVYCVNNVKDHDESDVDCGGSCSPCAEGKACSVDDDCAPGNECVDMVCTEIPAVVPQCSDGIDNDNDGKTDFPADTGCSSAEDNTEAEIVAPPVGLPSCGNGNCEAGENSENCVYDCGTCGDGVVFNEECEESADCYGGTCSGCNCIYNCIDNPPAPVNLFASSVRGADQMRVTWTLGSDIGCSLNEMLVYKCGTEGIISDCEPYGLVYTVKEKKSSYTFTDNDIKPDTNYCYQVIAYYGKSGNAVASSVACSVSGEEGCMQGNDYFCKDNIVFSCDSMNKGIEVQNCSKIESEVGSYICMGPDDSGDVGCTLQNNCDMCNNLFGLFWMYGTTASLVVAPVSGLVPGEVPCDADMVESCFIDSTKTNVDKYFFCSNMTSCYDYNSEAACEEDKCFMGSCEWSDSRDAGSELGIGVCRPSDPDKQNCSLCDNYISPERNRFFGTCSDSMCKVYGDCYYAKNAWGGIQCTSEKAIGCRAYTTKKDCVNSNETEEQAVVVDTEYDETTGKRTGNENSIETPSNDYFGFGTCKWAVDEFGAESCIKDADGNNESDCSVFDSRCQADNIPPETSIVPEAPMVGGRLLLGNEVFLKLETSEPVVTYFCFAPEGDECYPTESTACGIQKKVDYTGPYTMYYYSEDRAHNLEEVKSIDVEFDNTMPVIRDSSTTYNKRAQIIDLTAVNSDVTCSGHLEDDIGVLVYNNLIIDNEQVREGDTVSRAYTDLKDDNYHFVYECWNRAGNRYEGTVSFSIDNNRIHDPSPAYPVAENPVTMTVRTDAAAECSYGNTTGTDQKYESLQYVMTRSSDGKQHTSTQYVVPNEYYSFDVKCRFADGIEGEKNDRIRFSVDNTPPTIEAVSTFAAYGFDQTQTYGSKQTLMIQCRDDYFLKSKNIRGMDFRCGKTTYTYTDISTGEEVTKELPGEGLSEPFTVDSTQLIRFNTEDLGGNKETGGINVQIELEPTRLDIDVFKAPMTDASKPLEAVSFGDYIIRLSSSKNLVVADADAGVEGDQIYDIPVNFFRSDDFGKTQYFSFTVPWYLPKMEDKTLGINVTAVVAMPGEFCSLEAALDENKYYYAERYSFDTAIPEAELVPALKSYSKKPYFYPLNEEDGTYYTNQNTLFITGKAEESTSRVNFYVGQRLSDMTLQQIYDMSDNADAEELSDLEQFTGNAGENMVYYFGQDKAHISPGNYIEFDDKRIDYGHYGEYYRIIDTDPAITEIELDYPLESEVKLTDSAKIFNAPHPFDWFGTDIELEIGTNYFYMKPEGGGGQEGVLEDIYTIIYDPEPPKVIKQVPPKGYTENNKTVISIIVREPVGSSQLDLSSVKLYLNGVAAKLEPITNKSDGQYYYYNITHKPKELDGTYLVNFTGFDYALNPLTSTTSASPSWVFTVNEDAPEAPVFDIAGGVYYNDVWYTTESPVFSLFFRNPMPVEITGYYKNFVGNYINVPNCKGTRDANYFTECRFDPELSPRVIGAGGSFVENEYQIIVEARKTFSDGAVGPKSPLFLDKLVIDDVQPSIRSVVYPKKIRENYDVVFDAAVDNEAHDLNATLLFKGEFYQLTQIGRAGNHYYFSWRTPSLDFSDPAVKRDYEGNASIGLRIADYAGNFDTKVLSTYMDLSLPDIEHLNVNIMPTRVIDAGVVTNQTEIRMIGNFSDEDVTAVYVIPGDYVFVPGKKPMLEDISELANIVGRTFELTMIINGTFNTTIMNKLNIYMEDDAGNAAFTPLYVVADLQPPYVVSTSVS